MCVYVGVGKIACTLFVFAATTAVLPMNREMKRECKRASKSVHKLYVRIGLAIGGYGVHIPFEVMWRHEVMDAG